MRPKEEKDDAKPTYIMVPRRLIRTWIATTVALVIGIGVSFQYTNYVDTRSNRYWCNIVFLFNDTYEKSPPPTEVGKILAIEFDLLQEEFKCKKT